LNPALGGNKRQNKQVAGRKTLSGKASEQTIMSIAGHLSRKMLEHYSHICMAAKRTALDVPVITGS
jgi:hypothetical protein